MTRRPLVLVVFGTRPEGIKMMPVVKALRASSALDVRVAVTGQHRSMLDQVLQAFGEKADVDLDLMTPNQSLAQITARVMTRMGEVFETERPAMVLVHGDTTSAMAAATAAFYARVRIGHVEAGLRSHDLRNPWPEEFNRVAIDAIADLLFAPTETAAENLRREYTRPDGILVTGNTGIDAVLQMAKILEADAALGMTLSERYGFLDSDKRLVLVTGHRRESFGEGFERICSGLASIAERDDVEILYPVHLNPNVRRIVSERLGARAGVHLIDPVEYRDIIYLMKRAAIILTDSGGRQEEAPALGKPVLVMRDVTERPEAVATGVARLVGTDPDVIRREVGSLLDDSQEYSRRARPVFPYGDGAAAQRIVERLEMELA